MKKQSVIMQMMSLAWDNYKWESWRITNNELQELLSCLIRFNIPFEEDDFKNIYESFRGHYWFGVSSNGKTNGESFYSLAIQYNPSACTSFEKYMNRKPFIINGKRLGQHSELTYKGLYCHITGFESDGRLIYLAGYKDHTQKGKRKLFNFDNKEFLEARKEMSILK